MSSNQIILNVDDHEAARYARSRILSSEGFRVLEASTGGEALAQAIEHHPDLILLDVHLPDVDGIEVCRRLKLEQQERPIMVLQISASALSPMHAKEALDAGADAYLMEPVDPDVLVATVRAMLRLHEAERALVHANRQLEIVNRELKRSNQDLQQFAFAASHDLQQPLRAISTLTEVIEQEIGDKLTQQQKTHFAMVLAGAAQMRMLIADLLAYSQVGREGRPQSVTSVEKALSVAALNMREDLKEVGCKLEIADDLPSVLTDFTHLISVFSNLLSNALKYRTPGETPIIQVRAEQSSPAEWTIRVQDNGTGIPAEYQEQIFLPFKRLHGPEIAGTGIGLALCRRIVEASGGRIWAESAPGEGTTVCFTLHAA